MLLFEAELTLRRAGSCHILEVSWELIPSLRDSSQHQVNKPRIEKRAFQSKGANIDLHGRATDLEARFLWV